MMFNKEKGFSLVELMVVIAVSSILMTVAIPTFLGAKNRSSAQACSANLQIIKSAIQEWALDNPDTADANYDIKVKDINLYISEGFYSLKEPTLASPTNIQKYVTVGANGSFNTDGTTSDDVVGTISLSGELPTPTCNITPAISGHTI